MFGDLGQQLNDIREPYRYEFFNQRWTNPAFVLAAGGENINSLIQGRLMSLTMTDNRGFEADQLDIELDDSDGKLALPKRGETLSLHLGWKTNRWSTRGRLRLMRLNIAACQISSRSVVVVRTSATL